MNNDVLPTFEAHEARISTVLSDNGRECCGGPDRHPFELFLQLKEIEHRTTRSGRRNQTDSSSGCTERFSTSTSVSRAERSSTKASRKCRRTSMPISSAKWLTQVPLEPYLKPNPVVLHTLPGARVHEALLGTVMFFSMRYPHDPMNLPVIRQEFRISCAGPEITRRWGHNHSGIRLLDGRRLTPARVGVSPVVIDEL